MIVIRSSWLVDDAGHTHRIDRNEARYRRVAKVVARSRVSSETKRILAESAAARKRK